MGPPPQRPEQHSDGIAKLTEMFEASIPAHEVMAMLLEMQKTHKAEMDLAHSLVAVCAHRLGGSFVVTKAEALQLQEKDLALFCKRSKGTAYVAVAPRDTDPETFVFPGDEGGDDGDAA
jgi:Mor family transcriptional regulator